MITRDSYPMVLDPAHVKDILGIGRKQTYDLLNQVEVKVNKKKNPPFHIFRVGKLMKIPRDQFFDFIEGNSGSINL